MRAPRLSSPWREPEEESSFAITTDALMNTAQIESVASRREAFVSNKAIELSSPHFKRRWKAVHFGGVAALVAFLYSTTTCRQHPQLPLAPRGLYVLGHVSSETVPPHGHVAS